ncbi:flagellar biosynthetic protein FliR [Sulfitobacter marinus]|uniref:Flagellar biosynthetic protein FliR n=1 Tax=Sulfitobacter marinus TaxID=394264 RepID=A0A1I6TEP8_9RHOB|nr:flagellar biosynthetic protein FliR [Sulfitobacter marinus]SFS87598.1 flagellar biosynthetic protein FliR [Sulfitobacter marinus]
MISALEPLQALLGDSFWHIFIVFLRVGAVVSVMPAFGESIIPTRVKIIVAIAFTLIVAPAVSVTPSPNNIGTYVGQALAETTNGLMLGIGLRMFILALQTAGSIAAQSTSLSQILGGAASEPVPAMGYILVFAAFALAVTTGLHVKAAQLMIFSYQMLPLGVFPNAADLSMWGVHQISLAFSLAFTLAAPFVVLSLLYNLALGVINKAMPQLMVAFVGAPLITAGGLFILCIATPVLLQTWLEALNMFILNPFRVRP